MSVCAVACLGRKQHADALTDLRRLALQGINDRERHTPVTDVAAQRLSDERRAALVGQDVVDDLEGHAEVVAVAAQGVDGLFGAAGQQRADTRGRAADIGRLQADHPQIGLLRGIKLAGDGRFQRLSLAHLDARGAQRADGGQHVLGADAPLVALRVGQKGLEDEQITGEDRRGEAVLDVQGRLPAARAVAVDDVIVDKARDVAELGTGRGRDDALRVAACRTARIQQ